MKKKFITSMVVSLLTIQLFACSSNTGADKVYKNAKVYSVLLDGSEVHAEAVAIKDGKFVYVGDNNNVRKWIGNSTEVIDCKGNSVIPGLTDAHLHIATAATKLGSCDLKSIELDPEETSDTVVIKIQNKLREFINDPKHKDDAVIRGLGWDRMWFMGSLKETRPFDKSDIDAVVNDRPAVLTSYDGHVVMLNSKALEVADVTKDTAEDIDLIIKYKDGEHKGEPTGEIQEPVTYGPIIHKIPGYEFSKKEHHDYMLETMDMFKEMGYTLMCDAQQQETAYEVLSQMAKDGELNARINGVHNINDATRDLDLEKAIANRDKFNVGDMFRVDTVKYFADGTFSMLEPYIETATEIGKIPGEHEPLLWDLDHMKESMIKANEMGFNIHTHAMGSNAVRKVIDCYINAQAEHPSSTIRNIIAHCTFVSYYDRVRMGQNHIIASNQPGWFSDHPVIEPVYVKAWGEDVVKNTYPCKSLINNGVINAFGSDYAVNIPYGLSGLQVAMTRKVVKRDSTYEKYKDLVPPRPEECITLKEALQAHTINGAYQAHLENVTGSIEVGKSAELLVLDSDIETTPVKDIQDIKVLETVFKGNRVFKVK